MGSERKGYLKTAGQKKIVLGGIICGLAILILFALPFDATSPTEKQGEVEPAKTEQINVEEPAKTEQASVEENTNPDTPIKLPYKLDSKFMTNFWDDGACTMTFYGFWVTRGDTWDTYWPNVEITPSKTNDHCYVKLYEKDTAAASHFLDQDDLLNKGPDTVLISIVVNLSNGKDFDMYSFHDKAFRPSWQFSELYDVHQYIRNSVTLEKGVGIDSIHLNFIDLKKVRESGDARSGYDLNVGFFYKVLEAKLIER